MTTKQQIEIAEAILKTGLVSKVFHSCQMLKDENNRTLYPVYQRGAEFTYAGIDDTKGLFAYIRTNGDANGVPLKLASCARTYDMSAPMRIVFFSDNESRDHPTLLQQLLTFTFLTGLTLVRIIDDKHRLVKEESEIFRSSFDGKTFYVAIDVLVAFVLLPSSCDPDQCVTYQNPVTTCPAAAVTSTSSATS